MRLEHLFYDEISHKNVAFRAKLKCTCGCNSFSITHSGRLIKLLGWVNLSKKDSQLSIKCRCSSCQKEYVIYDSSIDGANPKGNIVNEFSMLELRKKTVFNIRLSYNYYENNFKTDDFESLFIDLKYIDSEKYIRICEI